MPSPAEVLHYVATLIAISLIAAFAYATGLKHATDKYTQAPKKPSFQSSEKQYVLNSLEQLRISWSQRERILAPEKAMMQKVCAAELERTILFIRGQMKMEEQ